MNIHRILQFGSKYLIPHRLWKCEKMFPKKLNLHPSSVHIHKSLFKNLIWSMSFILLWSVKHLNMDARSQDGSDIYGFPKRKWSLNVTYFYFAINITCFSLVQVSSFAVNAWTTLVVHTTFEVDLKFELVSHQILLKNALNGNFVIDSHWNLFTLKKENMRNG